MKKILIRFILLIIIFVFNTGCSTLMIPTQDNIINDTNNEKSYDNSIPKVIETDEIKDNDTITISYKIGDIGPAGGIIAYVNLENDDNWQYIEVAPLNWSNLEEDPKYIWGGRKYKVKELGKEVGDGLDNTKRIVDFVSQYEVEPYAALICDQLNFGGYNDWFLPSDEELMLIYNNLHLNGLGDFSIEDSYYSSSESTSLNSHIINMKKGNISSSSKNSLKYIRPIRRF